MLRRVHLHGSLANIHQGPIEVIADTVAEAIRAVSKQLSGFSPNAINGYRRVRVVGFESVESLFTYNDVEDVHLVPQFCGGKKGGFVQILIGAALVAASFIPGNPLAPLMLKVGALLIIGGLLQFFTAPARDKKDGAQNKSYYLGPPKNTVEIGTRIPILFGRRRIGGHYLSFNISSVDTGI